jgi:hypothetical protein
MSQNDRKFVSDQVRSGLMTDVNEYGDDDSNWVLFEDYADRHDLWPVSEFRVMRKKMVAEESMDGILKLTVSILVNEEDHLPRFVVTDVLAARRKDHEWPLLCLQ